ncbi:MAG: hypothetical protein AAFW47_05990, partial [Pseudomonadota bacterium]
MDQRVDPVPHVRNPDEEPRTWWRMMMPRGPYARALSIIIAPSVILHSVLVFVFMERHWNTVTRR